MNYFMKNFFPYVFVTAFLFIFLFRPWYLLEDEYKEAVNYNRESINYCNTYKDAEDVYIPKSVLELNQNSFYKWIAVNSHLQALYKSHAIYTAYTIQGETFVDTWNDVMTDELSQQPHASVVMQYFDSQYSTYEFKRNVACRIFLVDKLAFFLFIVSLFILFYKAKEYRKHIFVEMEKYENSSK